MGSLRHVLVVALLLGSVSCASPDGDAGAIRGVVRDWRTGRPVIYGEVAVVGSNTRTGRAIDGSFFLPQVKAGYATISIDRKIYPRRIHVHAGHTSRVNIFLQLKNPPKEPYFAARRLGDHRWYRVVGTKARVHKSTIGCEIVPIRQPFHVGEHPAFRVVMTNNSGRDVPLVMPDEGSADGNRYPIVTMTITGPENGLDIPRPVAGCGNINPLDPGSFKVVHPGEALEPLESAWWRGCEFERQTFAKAGDYTVTFRYSSNELNAARWHGQSPPTYEALMQVPRFDLEKSITVSVVE